MSPWRRSRRQIPEGKDIRWTLRWNYRRLRMISRSTDGVLTFASSPNFEAAADDGTDNTYEVTVVASAGTSTEGTVVMDNYPVTVRGHER